MIHYHGTPVSGTGSDAIRLLSGRHALIPFARPDNLGIALEVCQSVVLDNSAFSLWRAGGGDVDMIAYFAWVQELAGHPSVDWCIIPDKIDGTAQDNKALLMRWQDMGCKMESVPVWHMHDDLEWLGELVGQFRTVAIGSSGQWKVPGTMGWWERMSDVMRVACDENGCPRCRLHGLRMLSPYIFKDLPLASADSANASINAGSMRRFGMYPAPTAGQRADVIAARIENHQAASRWVEREQEEFAFLREPSNGLWSVF